MGAFHPQVVHFAVALLVVGVGFRLVSLLGRPAWIGPAAAALLLGGTLATFAAVKSETAIRIVPRGQSQWLEVVIKDDTGIVNGWFFGRNSIPGMIPGVNALFEGLVQLDEGEMTIANPYYEFI